MSEVDFWKRTAGSPHKDFFWLLEACEFLLKAMASIK